MSDDISLDKAFKRIEELEKKLNDTDNKLNHRTNELRKLQYQTVLLQRSMDSTFRSIFRARLEDYQNTHKGGRCFVIGNGPSLNKIDMSKLSNEITFGSNRAYVGFEKWGFAYDYWMVQDRILADQSADEFCERIPENVIKFIPYTILKFFDVGKLNNVVPVHLDYTKQCSFSNDPSALHEGFTVTIGLLQIAAIMGFSEIIMVGVDHNYVIPEENIDDDKKWSGKGLSNHFSDEYTNHENGHIWEMPDIEKMTKAYDSAANWAKENGVKILNASPGTKLDSFEKVDFEKVINNR